MSKDLASRAGHPHLMSMALDHAVTPEAFCTALKRAREERGISLEAISASTKISKSHLAALERGDLRHWPKGIFRRAFFRDYAKEIGIEAHYIDKFRRLFPEEGEERGCEGATVRGCEGAEVPDGRAPGELGEGIGLRLVLARSEMPPTTAWRRMLLSLLDSVILAALTVKVQLGAPRAWPEQRPVDESTDRPAPRKAWITDARRMPDASPHMRVRMRVVR